MGRSRFFFPQQALDSWIHEERVELTGDELTILSEGRKYRLTEAAHILRDATGESDAFDLVGRVKSVAFLTELGAEILDNSMIVGDSAYDIETGFMGVPVGTFAEHVSNPVAREAEHVSDHSAETSEPGSDEELLGQFLMRIL